MATLEIYRQTLEKPDSIHRGIQTLRGSHDIIPGQPVEVGHQRQLLMDRQVVDDLNGCYRTVHQPVKHPDNPIIKAEHPCECSGTSFGSVIREPDTGLFRLWTQVQDFELLKTKGKVPGSRRIHYYESEDGLNWQRPELGICEYQGSKANNILMNHSVLSDSSVFRLPERMQHRAKYAMCYAYLVGDLPDPENTHGMCNLIAVSQDGIHWTDLPENPIWYGRTDTNNCIIYNPDRDVFMMYRRATINAGQIRRIAYSESKDLISWTQPIIVIPWDEHEKGPFFLYGMPVSYYHGVYLGLLYRLHMHPDYQHQTLGTGQDFKMDTELAWSRDGIHWERHMLRPAFIPNSPSWSGAYDWGFAQGITNIIEMDDEVRVYYNSRERLHPPGVNIPEDPKRTHISLTTLRRDGFVSIDANDDGGYMLTKPLAYPGGKLHLNAKTAADGFIRVAVREGLGVRDGEWPEDWRFDKSVPFTNDSLDHTLAWKQGQTLDTFPGKVLRLHFWMEKAELYSFWFE